MTDSKVKMTSGWGWLGAPGLPSNTTVSPDKTLFTRATPVAGRIMGGVKGAVVVVVVAVEVIFFKIKVVKK